MGGWQERMEDVLAPLSHAVLVIDGDGRLAFMNPAAEETLGLERDDVLGLHYSELPWRPLDDDGSHMAMADRSITRILAGSQEAFRLQRAEVEYRDGSRATLLLDGGPIREEDGSLAGVVVAFTDVTEQLRTERALRQSEERYRQLFANMNEGVALHEMVYDEAGVPIDYVVRDVNVVFEDIVGVSRSEAAGRRATDLYGTGQAPYLEIYAEVAATGVPVSFETYFPPLDRHFIVSAFSPVRGEFATVFTDISSQKRLETEMQSRASRLEGLYRTAELAGASLDAEDIARSYVANAISRLGLAIAAVLLVDEAEGVLTPVAHRGLPIGFWDRIPPFTVDGRNMASVVWRTGEPVAFGNLDDPAVPQATRGAARLVPELRALIVVPVQARRETIGVALFGWTRERDFDADDLDYFTSMANALAVGIMNARLYAAEHHIAQTLQEALLVVPDRLPGLVIDDLYRSATEAATVGGDFYDVFQIEQGRAGIIIGDVSGKGVSAAAMTVLVKSIVKAAAYRGLTPAEVMAEANEATIRASAEGIFATVFFGVLDTRTGELCYCSGGHPPGMVRRADGEVEVLAGHSPIVGGFAGVRYGDQCMHLERGDTLVLYTDGVLEARDGGELYGEERLVRVVAETAEDLPSAIVAGVRDFTGGRLPDDAAVLAVKYLPGDGVVEGS